MSESLEKDSKYNSYDEDNNGVVSDNELSQVEKIMQIENEDKKQDAQRQMAWVAMISMCVFALLPLMPFVPESRLATLASLSDMLFLSQASVVGMFFGAQAYMSKNQ